MAPKVRARVLDTHRYDELQAYERWGYTYEDAKRTGAILGLTIEDIHFDDFHASLTGAYAFAPEAIAQIKAEAPQDEELHRLAAELTAVNATCFIEHGAKLCAKLTEGRHSNTAIEIWMADSVNGLSWACEGPSTAAFDKLLRDFVRWIHKQLMNEEYLSSDEAVSERLADEDFDEDGGII